MIACPPVPRPHWHIVPAGVLYAVARSHCGPVEDCPDHPVWRGGCQAGAAGGRAGRPGTGGGSGVASRPAGRSGAGGATGVVRLAQPLGLPGVRKLGDEVHDALLRSSPPRLAAVHTGDERAATRWTARGEISAVGLLRRRQQRRTVSALPEIRPAQRRGAASACKSRLGLASHCSPPAARGVFAAQQKAAVASATNWRCGWTRISVIERWRFL